MDKFFTVLAEYNGVINTFVWTTLGLVLLLFTGVLTTVLTKVFQLSHLAHWWNNTIGSMFKKDVISHSKDKASISPFQALCTALAATIGVGNIAGVAAAICIGGPGAVFWMWVAAFFGMMTNYSENVLGIYFRRKNKDGEWSGGAMYYLQDGLGSKKGFKHIGKILAVLFSIFTLLASFGIGAMGQINKIVANIENAFRIDALASVQLYDGVTLYSVVIGADTMVFVDGETLGKPKSEEEARQMLRRLSGRSHFVCTGFAVVDNRNGKEACGVERTEVKFRSLSENEIEKYIQSKEPMDKAGAYGIQGKGALFIEGIRGDYFNVVGLPLCALSEMLKKEFDIELF